MVLLFLLNLLSSVLSYAIRTTAKSVAAAVAAAVGLGLKPIRSSSFPHGSDLRLKRMIANNSHLALGCWWPQAAALPAADHVEEVAQVASNSGNKTIDH